MNADTGTTKRFKVRDVVLALKVAENAMSGIGQTIPFTSLGRALFTGLGAQLPFTASDYLKDPTKNGAAAKSSLDLILELLETVSGMARVPSAPANEWFGRGLFGSKQPNPAADYWNEGDAGREALSKTIEQLEAVRDALASDEVDTSSESTDEAAKGVQIIMMPSPLGMGVFITGDPERIPAVLSEVATRFGLKPTSVCTTTAEPAGAVQPDAASAAASTASSDPGSANAPSPDEAKA